MRNINDVISENLMTDTGSYEDFKTKFKALDKAITDTITKLVLKYQEDNDEDGEDEHDGIEFETPVTLRNDIGNELIEDEEYCMQRIFVRDGDDLNIYTDADQEIDVAIKLTIYHKLDILKAIEDFLKTHD